MDPDALLNDIPLKRKLTREQIKTKIEDKEFSISTKNVDIINNNTITMDDFIVRSIIGRGG